MTRWCSDELIALPGTVRASSPEHTWEWVSGHLREFGITRVARLTGLDCIGMPVWAAIRPASLTLSVSQGKGTTDRLAQLSAVMEAIELWHVEQPLPIIAHGAPADVGANCPIAALPLTVPHSERTLAGMVWDWTSGTGLLREQTALLPLDLVRRRVQRPEWAPNLLRATSTGLACGNTRDEAVLHALFEVIERDVLFRDELVQGQRRTPINLTTVDDPDARALLDRFAAADMAVELALVHGPYRLPVCVAYLWAHDIPTVFAGGGCHISPVIAAIRALTEAAQSRVTAIAGTRDDLPSEPFDTTPTLPAPAPADASWPHATARFAAIHGSFATQVTEIARRVEHVTGYEPIALDLSTVAGPAVPAVQVVCPGTRSRIRRSMPR